MTSANDPDRLQKVYMTINVESDGPDPALNNLLELSCVLHFENGSIIDELNIKFSPLPNKKPDLFTMENFWNVNIEAWNWVTSDTVDVDTGMNQFVEFYENYSKRYSIRFVGDPASRDFVWLQEYYTNFAMFSTIKLFPYCRCLTTMRKSYQKMLNLTDDESWTLKNKMQLGEGDNESKQQNNHIGIERARRQAREFCLLRHKMYKFQYSNQVKELNDFVQVINSNIFSFKNEVVLEFENILNSKINELKNYIKNEQNQTVEQIKELLKQSNSNHRSSWDTLYQSLVPYENLPSLPNLQLE